MLVYVLALCAAAMFGIGSVVQQRVAFDAPPGNTLKLRLLLYLVRQRLWLVGVATAFVGNGFSATALGMGSVALVQPLLVSRLLFALPLAAAWARQRLSVRDWLGMAATAGGLALFLIAGHPRENSGQTGGWLTWVSTIAGIALFIGLLVTLARRLSPDHEAPVLGVGAGMLFGLQSGLTHAAVGSFGTAGLAGLLLNPATYAVAVTAVLGTLLTQSAYEMAPLTASYPALAAVEPLTGIAIGVWILDSSIALGPVVVLLELAGLLVMTVGIFMLSTSPLIGGEHEAMQRRRQEKEAADKEDDLGRTLQGLGEAMDDVEQHGKTATGSTDLQDLRERLHAARDEVDSLSQLNQGHDQFGTSGATDPEDEHAMREWRRERREREDSLRDTADGLLRRLERLGR